MGRETPPPTPGRWEEAFRARYPDADEIVLTFDAGGANSVRSTRFKEDLVALTTKCLMPAPAARPQSAEAVAKSVHEHLAAAEQRAHDATVRTLALKRTQKLGITLTVVIAAGLAAFNRSGLHD